MSSMVERLRGRRPTLPMVRPQGSIPSALTASAARQASLIARGEGQKAQSWQIDSLAYYDQLGVVRYASMFWARALTKVRWYVGELQDDGEIIESENPKAQDLLARVHDPQGGRSQMMQAYGQLRFLTGECYLIWTKPDPAESDLDEMWEIVSVLELRQEGSRLVGERRVPTYRRIMAPGLTPKELVEVPDDDFEPLPNNVIVYRFWRRHPAYTMLADAPMRSVLAECEEIVRATQTINARLVSRMAGAGVFAIPKSWTLTSVNDAAAIDNPRENPFQRALTDAMMAAIANPGSAEAVAPIVIAVPDETTAFGKIYKVWDPAEEIREVELRDRAIDRFAIGVDMPPEKLKGLGETSHWNAWMIDEEAWAHIAPVAQEFSDDLTGAYLLPAAREENISGWERFVVAYDPSEFLANPDSFSDAKDMYDRRAVGKAYLREAGNANDDDAPTDEELEEMILVAIKKPVEVEGGAVQEAEETEGDEDDPPIGDETERAAPAEPEDNGNAAASLTYRILGAAETEIEAMRQRAGSRLRSHVQGNCEHCAEQIRGVENSQVAPVLGAETLAEVAPPIEPIVRGSATSFVTTLKRWGVSEPRARVLAELLESHVVTTLTEENPSLPAGFGARLSGLVT